MSRSDEEGFHPHPGDPWHPGWEGVDDDDADLFAPKPEKPAAKDRPKTRGRFGRRKAEQEQDEEPEPATHEPVETPDDDLPEPSGWEAYDDDLIAADLESVVSDVAPSWTDEGGSSVEFESAFTVGGDLGSDDAVAEDLPGEPDLDAPSEDGFDLGTVGLTGEPAAPGTSEEPTLLLDEIVLPDLPDLSGLAATAEDAEEARGSGVGESPDDEPIPHLDELLSSRGRGDDSDAEPTDSSVVEIPESAGVGDLTRAAEDAAAALRSRASEMRQDQALEMMAGELGATEVDEVPEPPEPPPAPSQGIQDTLLSAGLDLSDEAEPSSDPGYTPEVEEFEDDGSGAVGAAPILPVAEAEAFPGDLEPAEIVSVEAVDAALLAIAAEPLSAADPDALDALRAIDEDEDVDDWHAYAEGEAVGVGQMPGVAAAEDVLGDLAPPLLPRADEDGFYDDPTETDEPAPKRGLFGRRKTRKEDAGQEVEDAGEDGGGWEDSGDYLPEVAPAAGDEEPVEADEFGTVPTPEAPSLGDVLTPAAEEEEDWGDSLGGDDEADAFFGAED
ncbi:MAG: hypothetical protein MUP76_04555, partial [Acidimicrobiia bacterium]|nr:hypothetical protein [Acidimicrobiia bacterium]